MDEQTRYRVTGSLFLLAVAVIVFPMLFDGEGLPPVEIEPLSVERVTPTVMRREDVAPATDLLERSAELSAQVDEEGFLTEEFIAGDFFTELPQDRVTLESMYELGCRLGDMLARLHQQGIIYNDATLSDPDGRSHLMVQAEGSCRLLDFGVSVRLAPGEQLSLEEVYNLARTTPMFRVFAGMNTVDEGMMRFLESYGRQLRRTPLKELMDRDRIFAQEGLNAAAQRLGREIVEPFWEGFAENYA